MALRFWLGGSLVAVALLASCTTAGMLPAPDGSTELILEYPTPHAWCYINRLPPYSMACVPR